MITVKMLLTIKYDSTAYEILVENLFKYSGNFSITYCILKKEFFLYDRSKVLTQYSSLWLVPFQIKLIQNYEFYDTATRPQRLYLIFTHKIEFFRVLVNQILSKFKLMKCYYTNAMCKKSTITQLNNLKELNIKH